MSRRVERQYRQFKASAQPKTMRQICYPTSYELQMPQLFLEEFMSPESQHTGVLVFHQPGAGKTCAAIRIAERYISVRRPLIILPAILKDNFRDELRTPCGQGHYLREEEAELLSRLDPDDPERLEIIRRSDQRIDANYDIYSYHRAVPLLQKGELDLSGRLVVIDEVHNMISSTGIHYQVLENALRRADPPPRVVLLSATPIFDRPAEIARTLNLLLPEDRQMLTDEEFYDHYVQTRVVRGVVEHQMQHEDEFRAAVRGYVSFYRGGSPVAYPKTTIEYVRVLMSDHVYRRYEKIREGEMMSIDGLTEQVTNSFLSGTRMASNIVYPGGSMKQEGLAKMRPSDWTLERIARYAPKFPALLHRLRNAHGPSLVYSSFKGAGGIEPLTRFLEVQGWQDVSTAGPGPRRYALWSGDIPADEKKRILAIYNHPDNRDGGRCAVILGSPSIREGVSLKRVRSVHLLDPYFNWSRMDQVIGRASRLCSHRDLPARERQVQVYIYLAVHPRAKPYSVDEHILQMAIDKQRITTQFLQALKGAAVDCHLWKAVNSYKGEPEIVCAD